MNLSHEILLVLLSQIWKENTLLFLNIEELNTSDLRLHLKTIQRLVAQQLLTRKMKAHTNAPTEQDEITITCCPLPVSLHSREFLIKADI